MRNYIKSGLQGIVLGAALGAAALSGCVRKDYHRNDAAADRIGIVYVEPEKEGGIDRKWKNDNYKDNVMAEASKLSDKDKKLYSFFSRVYGINADGLDDKAMIELAKRRPSEGIKSYFDGESRMRKGGGAFNDIFGYYYAGEEIMLTGEGAGNGCALKIADLDKQRFMHVNTRVKEEKGKKSYTFEPGTFSPGNYALLWFEKGICVGGNTLTVVDKEAEKIKSQ